MSIIFIIGKYSLNCQADRKNSRSDPRLTRDIIWTLERGIRQEFVRAQPLNLDASNCFLVFTLVAHEGFAAFTLALTDEESLAEYYRKRMFKSQQQRILLSTYSNRGIGTTVQKLTNDAQHGRQTPTQEARLTVGNGLTRMSPWRNRNSTNVEASLVLRHGIILSDHKTK